MGSGVLLAHRKILLLLLNVSIGYSVIDYFIVLRDVPHFSFLPKVQGNLTPVLFAI